MSTMVLSMDEIINALCLHMAERKAVRPEDVQVELSWEEDTGYSAEVWVQGRSQYLVESNMIGRSCVTCLANMAFVPIAKM